MRKSTVIAATAAALLAGASIVHAQGPAKPGPDGSRGGLQTADADKDGRISRAEHASHASERFTRMDVNKDGFIDQADRQQRMQQRHAERFEELDGDHDGRITRAEFEAAHAKRMARNMASRAEREAAGKPVRPMPTDQARQKRHDAMFARLDGNKDGAVTRAEFDAARTAKRDGHHGQRRGMRGDRPQQ